MRQAKLEQPGGKVQFSSCQIIVQHERCTGRQDFERKTPSMIINNYQTKSSPDRKEASIKAKSRSAIRIFTSSTMFCNADKKSIPNQFSSLPSSITGHTPRARRRYDKLSHNLYAGVQAHKISGKLCDRIF